MKPKKLEQVMNSSRQPYTVIQIETKLIWKLEQQPTAKMKLKKLEQYEQQPTALYCYTNRN